MELVRINERTNKGSEMADQNASYRTVSETGLGEYTEKKKSDDSN